MKRILSLLIALVMLCSVYGSTAAATDLIAISHEKLPLLNTIANVQAVNGSDAITVISGENAPSVIFVEAAQTEDIRALFAACVEHTVIPVVNITDASQVTAVLDAREDSGCLDMAITSPKAAILGNVRRKKLNIRTGLICEWNGDTLSSEEAHTIRTEVRGAPATFCVLSCESASRQAVAELQELAVAVWVQTDTTSDADILRAVTSGANGIITPDADGAAAIINTYLEENAMTRTPILIGHRGNPTQAPENSLSGFLKAYENGADVFEVDVEITKDGELIIMHDDTITRTTDYDGDLRVGEMTLAEIKSYHLLGLDGAVTNETVPTFREVLEEFKDKDCRIFVEFKGYNVQNVTAAAKLLQEYGMEHRVDVISFNTNLIKQTQTEMKGMSTGYLHSAGGIANSYGMAILALDMSLTNAQISKSTVNPNKSIFTTHFMQAATDRGMTVWPWTFYIGDINKAFLICPDGLTTDDVQWATDMVKYMVAETETPVIKAGSSAEMTVSAVTYGGDRIPLSANDLTVTVIDGEEHITVDGTKVTAVSNGDATVLFGHKTETADGSEYVVYAQPVTITVGEPITEAPAAEKGNEFVSILIVVGACVVGIAIIVGVVVFFKPKKK